MLKPGLSIRTFAALLCLLVLPVCAITGLSTGLDWRLIVGTPLILSVFTFLAYHSDKRRAEAGKWRLRESALHLLELLGGWPGAFLAQRIFRHKTSKISYQVVFWAIVLVYQLVALDCVTGWTVSGELVRCFRGQVG